MRLLFNFYVIMAIFPIVIACSNGKSNERQSVFNVIVAQDGSGDFTNIQSAINAVPDSLKFPWLIFIKNGYYKETVLIPESKPFIHLIGQSKEKTIIHEKLHVGAIPDPQSSWYKSDSVAWPFSVHNPESDVYKMQGSIVLINSTNFYAENISFINDFGVESQTGPQALAIKITADKNAFKNCIFRSFQDTWQTSLKDQDRLYINNCWIEGAVDYFYGGGDALVEYSTLYNLKSESVIVAPAQSEALYGYIFRECVIDGNKKPTENQNLPKLGRPWHNSPKAVFIHTKMNIPIDPKGWTDMGTVPALFAEYESRDSNDNLLDLSKRKTEYSSRGENPLKGSSRTTIKKEEAAQMVYENIILRKGDDWDPRNIMTPTSTPSNLVIKKNTLVWTPVEGAIGYIIFDGEEILGITNEPKFNLSLDNKHDVRVCTVSRYGVLSEKSNLVQ